MNDSYLFRGKRASNGEWMVGFPLLYEHNGKPQAQINNDFIDSDTETWYAQTRVEPSTIGQCTGLRDKDGTLIFEGDIVKYEGKNRAIRYMPKYAAYALSKIEYGLVLAWEYVDRMEVIGNIHDNPELTEADNERDN